MSLLSKTLGLDKHPVILGALNSVIKSIASALGLPDHAPTHTDIDAAATALAATAAVVGSQRIVGAVSTEIDKAPVPDADKADLKTAAADAILSGVAKATGLGG